MMNPGARLGIGLVLASIAAASGLSGPIDEEIGTDIVKN
jgi:hypothetical protein